VPYFFNTGTVLDKSVNPYALSKKHFSEWGQLQAIKGEIRFIDIHLEQMYGPKDNISKFPTYVINNLKKNVPELNLTLGEQKRDFIFIDDVISAYLVLLKKSGEFSHYQSFDLGSGQLVTIRHFVETVKQLTDSKTKLNFGAIPYRSHEVMESQSNIKPLLKLGWYPKVSLAEGINLCLERSSLDETVDHRRMRFSRK
jgi:CDP-paratose synthetase